MINLELSAAHREIFQGLMQVSEHMIRPYSRQYDREEHSYPKEMEEVGKLLGDARGGGGNKKGKSEGINK